jgi:hypothetical protein
MIIRRIFGLIIFLIGLTILILSLVGAFYVSGFVDNLAEGVTNSLALASQSLDTARNTLVLARDTVSDANDGLSATAGTMASASQTLADSRGMIDNVSAVTTQEVPEAIEGIQAALPNVIQVAAIIDRTLVALSSFGIDRVINLPLGGSIPIQFDLGIDYDPAVSFDESLREFESSLVGLPESLRGLEDDLRVANENLTTLSTDLLATSENLTAINARVGEIIPLLDQYTTLVDQLSDTITQVEGNLASRLNTLKIGLIALLVGLGLTQLASIYLGWELLSGQRAPVRYEPMLVAPENQPAAWPLTNEPPTFGEPLPETKAVGYELLNDTDDRRS